ncbi:MAG TPA: hypothetical protein VFE82_17540 [Ramlibacter sp.]|jgi:hypothetical protein|uniref:hypothetical protein n=1 Tax=Ramlibacter sp. TaxID=1917967 RepID=UPI002D541AA2|nr:hypothetical protein [Ramlibacter sp.]HZY20278.1 hypothetical protein [Ramlibacter sp.]
MDAPARFELERTAGYAIARVCGPARAEDYAAAIRALARYTREQQLRHALADCLGVTLKLGFSDHYAIGRHIADELHHLDRMVTVLPEPMITRASEKVAAGAGLQLRVMSDLAAAVAFLEEGLRAPAAAGQAGGPVQG